MPNAWGKRGMSAPHHPQRAHRELLEGGVAGEVGQAQQHVRRLRVAGRRRVVLDLAGAGHQGLPVRARVEEAAPLGVGEERDHPVRELPRRGEPARRERGGVEAQQAVAEVGVVVELPQVRGARAGVDPAQPPVDDQAVQHEGRRRRGGVDVVVAAQDHAALGERRDREPVPRGHHLVVAGRRRALGAGGVERRAGRVEQRGRVLAQLARHGVQRRDDVEDRGALEVALRR